MSDCGWLMALFFPKSASSFVVSTFWTAPVPAYLFSPSFSPVGTDLEEEEEQVLYYPVYNAQKRKYGLLAGAVFRNFEDMDLSNLDPVAEGFVRFFLGEIDVDDRQLQLLLGPFEYWDASPFEHFGLCFIQDCDKDPKGWKRVTIDIYLEETNAGRDMNTIIYERKYMVSDLAYWIKTRAFWIWRETGCRIVTLSA